MFRGFGGRESDGVQKTRAGSDEGEQEIKTQETRNVSLFLKPKPWRYSALVYYLYMCGVCTCACVMMWT